MLTVKETDARRRQRGISIAVVTAVVSGFAVFVNGYGVRAWSEVATASTYTTFKNLVAAVVLVGGGVAVSRWRSSEGLQRPDNAAQWIRLSLVAIVGGSVPFLLFFEGLARASSGQAGFIHKTLIVWVGILAVVFLKERIGPFHLLAIALLVWGQAVLIGGLSELSLGTGELMMLAATMLWAAETIVAKRLLGALSAMTVGVARMAGGAVLLVVVGLLRGSFSDLGALQPHHIGWVLLTGAVLSAYVASWYMALARAQAIDVTAVLVGGALLTALLNTGIRGAQVPSLTGLTLVACGVAVAVAASWNRRRAQLR